MKLIDNIKIFKIQNCKQIIDENWIFNIPIEIINFIFSIRDKETEKGGFLIGYKIKDAKEFTIEKISLPIKKDTSSIDHFYISRKHKKNIKKYLKKCNKNLIVIGIWHTHPGVMYTPSYDDLQLYKRLSKKSNLRFSLNTITTSNKTNFIIYDKWKERIKKCKYLLM